MHFALTDEQDDLRRTARVWLAEHYPLERDYEGSYDDNWMELAKLGWLGVSVAEERGGAGLGFIEEALLCEELGYVLYPGPFLTTVGFAVAALAGEDQEAVAVGAARWSVELDGLVPLLGSVDYVLAADGLAHDANGEVLPSIDPDRPLGRLTAGEGRPVAACLTSARVRAAMAAEAVGVARRGLELGVEYAAKRKQFGKPIGAYQAVSHQLAESFADIELARSLSWWAAWCVCDGDSNAAVAAAAAKACATEAAVAVCERSIQVHGGLGFTWEHPIHRYYKRALWLHALGGTPTQLRAEVADVVIGGVGT